MSLVSCSGNVPAPKENTAPTVAEKPESAPAKPLVTYKEDGPEHGTGDIGMSIVSISRTDSATRYKAVSLWQNRPVGFLVTVPDKEGDQGFAKGLAITGIGPESDHFLSGLAGIYGQKIDSAAHFADAFALTYVNLRAFAKSQGAKDDGPPAKTEYKLFFPDPKTGESAELYLNIDSAARELELNEKDSEYRGGIIKFLSK